MRKKFIIGLLAISALVPTVKAVPVGLELALLVDVSGSIDGTEYALQKQGYVQVFQSAAIQALIGQVAGGIAVTYIEWSGGSQQSQSVGWTHLTDAASASAFASAINSATRSFSGSTAPGSAINYAAPLFNNAFEGDRQVIDVSGDGEQNDGFNTATARNNALAGGIDKINGLAIQTSDFPNLAVWYAQNVQGGTGSFTIAVNSFADFANAVERKIRAEITNTNPDPVPDGGPGALLVMLLFGGMLPFVRRAQQANG